MRLIEQQDAIGGGAIMPPVFRAIDLASYGDDLRRFARRRVRDHALAEDAVQDAMESALVSLPTFQGKSSLKTWLMGILAHKIQDAFRREVRYVRLPGEDGDDSSNPAEEGAEGSFDPRVADNDPVREVSRRRFSESVQLAMDRLPPSLREVFQLQAIEGLETGEVCRQLGISEGNCWVRLHRARKILPAQLGDHL
jgi:RNA polymerase sigma-70 factor (ECF subfamily)